MRVFCKKGINLKLLLLIIGSIIGFLLISSVFLLTFGGPFSFKNRIQEKTDEILAYELQTQLEQQKEESFLQCRYACAKANDNNCTLRAKAAFCIKKLEPIDLDLDQETKEFDQSFLGGVGICEDGIYCPMIMECICGEELTFNKCKDILCSYWTNSGLTREIASTKLKDGWYIGSCQSDPNYDESIMWHNVLLDGNLSCG